METHHRPAHLLEQRRHRKTELVRHALEDRGVSQDIEIGLQGRRPKARNRSTLVEPCFGLLHPELAGVLDDDDESSNTEHIPQTCSHRYEKARSSTILWETPAEAQREQRHCPTTSRKSPGSVGISRAQAILHPAIWSCGRACHDPWISNWVQPWEPDLWVIERPTGPRTRFLTVPVPSPRLSCKSGFWQSTNAKPSDNK